MTTQGNPEGNIELGSHPNSGEEIERIEVQGVRVIRKGDLERYIFHQVELNADEENDSVEIKRKKSMARTALTMWKESLDTCERKILQYESEIRSIINEVYTLVSLYSVFEGVVLTAVAQSNRLECQHLWSPVGLSAFVYFMLIIVAFTKFKEIHDFNGGIQFNMSMEMNIWRRISDLKERGYANFDFDSDDKDRRIQRKVPFWRNALSLIVPLSIFTMGLVFSFIHILCWS